MFAALLAAAEEAAETTEKSLKVLPDPDELLFGTIFFLLLVVIMFKLVFPRLRGGLEKRREAIQGKLEEAERAKTEADRILEEYRQQLADARGEVARIIEEGKRTADALRQDLVARAEREASEIVARAQADVGAERDRAVQSLRSTLADLSIQIASRVVEKELASSESHRALVDRAISELSPANGHG